VPRALPRRRADDELEKPSLALEGLLSHLDVVYRFAFILTGGDADRAEALTEDAFGSVHDDLWSTLGGHGLRDRLLARCVIVYRQADARTVVRRAAAPQRPTDDSQALGDLVLDLPWEQRAAIALVDQLGTTYAGGAAVLGMDVTEFRAFLHRGRSVLFAAHRALVR